MANKAMAQRMEAPYMKELAAADKKIVKRYFLGAGKSEAAASRAMGINRTTLRKKLDLYDLKA